MKLLRPIPALPALAALAAALLVSACGGGGGGSAAMPMAAPAPTATAQSASPGSSSGSISAFGSVFVNGHEFDTRNARVLDDDAGSGDLGLGALEVGMTVDVVPAADSTEAHPDAAEVHLHPLARGIVDAVSAGASTLTVMGQTVQVTAATNFSDHRACLTAATPCSAVTGLVGLGGLAVTSGSGASAVPGSYVTVFGYLYGSGAPGSGSSIVATLVSVRDPLTGPVAYKAEGLVGAASGSTLTLGGLTVDLSLATCRSGGVDVPCGGAFAVGQLVSVVGATQPALPATSFQPGLAWLRNALLVHSDGSAVELEGKVGSVATSPASFTLRGLEIDASALPAASLPAVGDIVRVTGTVAAGGTAVKAGAVTLLHAAHAPTYGFEGDVGGVAAGPAAGTYTLTLLGQAITVDASTRLADRSQRNGDDGPTPNPFNITTFQTYLAASVSQHLRVKVQADATGALSALSVTIVPPATTAGVGGRVDATPAPVNGAAGTPTVFSVHGLPVSADPAAVIGLGRDWQHPLSTRVQAGDLVLVRGTWAGGTLTVTAPIGPSSFVIDKGRPQGDDDDLF
ncbi:MAG: hypothetical protein KGL50_10070 [Burkholderiales bacterium]|nr:hypothetical protein [Burkholderiales bacterium]